MREGSSRQPPNAIWRSVAISVTLHLIAISAVGLLSAKRPLPPPSEQSITVEILAEPQSAVAGAPSIIERKNAPLPSPSSADEAHKETGTKPVTPTEVESEDNGMVHAKELFSAKILADPRSKGALIALRQLAREDRIIQLCNVEVMEQVHTWNSNYQPDFVVAYATADTKLSGLALQADGGALRSKRHWYDVKFRCEVTPDLEKVVAFEFSLGAEIPQSEWGTHSLPVGDGPSD